MEWLELLWELMQRRAYYTLYLGIVAIWFGALGARGLLLQETRGFGWNALPAQGPDAVRAGVIWSVLALILASSALALVLR
jgi:hypothetical protein